LRLVKRRKRGGSFYDSALGCQLEHSGFVLRGREPQEKGAAFLAFEFAHGPAFEDGLFFIKTAFEVVVNFDKFNKMRPSQFVRQIFNFGVCQKT